MVRYLILKLCALAAAFFFVSATHAAPVTFRFEATVNSIANTVPFDSGLEVGIGDIVSGTFTFRPQFVNGQQSLEVVQPFPANIFIDKKAFTIPPLINNLTLRSFNDIGIIDFPPATIIDLIELGSTLGPSDPEVLSNVALDQSSFRIVLFGDISAQSVAGFLAEPEIWNTYQIRRALTVNIRGKSGGALAFGAMIHDFVMVPEPTTLILGVLVCITLTGSCTRFIGR